MKTFLCRGLVVASAFVTSRALAEPPGRTERTEALGRSGDASVSLGVLREQSDVRSELAGFLRVQVPLDRFAAPRRALVASAEEARFVGEDDDFRDDERVADPGEPDGAVAPALDPALLGGLARETLAAALNVHGVHAYERELDGATTRARTSAVLPEVRLRAAKTRDASLRLAPTVDDPYHASLADGDGVFLEAQATFRLNRLIFADEEVPLERLRIERERLNERLELRGGRARGRRDRARRAHGRLVRRARSTPRARRATRGTACAAAEKTRRTQARLEILHRRRKPGQERRLGGMPAVCYIASAMLAEARNGLQDLQRRVDALRGSL